MKKTMLALAAALALATPAAPAGATTYRHAFQGDLGLQCTLLATILPVLPDHRPLQLAFLSQRSFLSAGGEHVLVVDVALFRRHQLRKQFSFAARIGVHGSARDRRIEIRDTPPPSIVYAKTCGAD